MPAYHRLISFKETPLLSWQTRQRWSLDSSVGLSFLKRHFIVWRFLAWALCRDFPRCFYGAYSFNHTGNCVVLYGPWAVPGNSRPCVHLRSSAELDVRSFAVLHWLFGASIGFQRAYCLPKCKSPPVVKDQSVMCLFQVENEKAWKAGARTFCYGISSHSNGLEKTEHARRGILAKKYGGTLPSRLSPPPSLVLSPDRALMY